jgi:FkbM family methyltransferase
MNDFINLSRASMVATGICFNNRRFALLTSKARWRQIRIETGKLIDLFMFEVMERLNIELFLQCGANEPSTAISFCSINEKNKAICFEANPDVAQRFQSNAMYSNLQYINIGLGSAPGDIDFHIPVGNRRDLSLQGTFSPAKHLDYTNPIKVRIDTLDNLLLTPYQNSESLSTSPKLTALLIDVEGYSWNVLQGAHQLLALPTTKVIFIEVQDINFYWEHEKNAKQICDFLLNYGFVPIVRDYPTAMLYNIVFIKATEVEKITDLIDQYWFNWTQIRPKYYEKIHLKFYFSKIKKSILKIFPGVTHGILHRLFAFFGSKQSADKYLKS